MSIHSCNTSPQQYFPFYYYPERAIDLELFIDAIIYREDAGTTVTMLNGDPLSFAEFCFLIYLYQQIQQHEQDLKQE